MPELLTEDEVHVWYCLCDDASVIAKQCQYLALLTDDEIARYERFTFEKDRRLFLVARAMLRTMLSRYTTVAPAAWRFEQSDKGKLFLRADPQLPRFEFNVSHSPHMAVCAITLNRRVGVDVESVTGRASMRVARHFLSPEELARFLEVEVAKQRDLFYRLWTLKESYAKALGMGLSLRFTEFSFLLSETEPPTIVFESPGNVPAEYWQFHQQMISPHYCLAVAVERPNLPRVRFSVQYQPPLLNGP